LLGVADPRLIEPVAQTLAALGVEQALVVHGAGLDEIALHADTTAVRLRAATIEPLIIRPEDAGLARAPLEAIAGGSPVENGERLLRLLERSAPAAERDLVALNSGALLMTAGLASDLAEGAGMALEAIGSGAAADCLRRFIKASNA
jgi:anthranilate phosphoribosyltransferase